MSSKIIGSWAGTKTPTPATITPNSFTHKSLSNFALNFSIGCLHACKDCYVPSTSANKLAPHLSRLGVSDPDAQWGDYTFVREWDERAFLASVAAAENAPRTELKPDGHRAVMMCSTTDAYQTVPDRPLNDKLRVMVRRSLELIRDRSTLNVRILTRSPLVRADFDLIESLGNRVMLGMSIPTLDNHISRIYEPAAPAPTLRLKTLAEASARGIPTFVAMAPIFPECTIADISRTLTEIKRINPLTVFAEPINIRAENAARIAAHAESIGVRVNTEVFETRESWQDYALTTLHTVEEIAIAVGLGDRLHLWPDASLGTAVAARRLSTTQRAAHQAWIEKCWSRISEWPAS